MKKASIILLLILILNKSNSQPFVTLLRNIESSYSCNQGSEFKMVSDGTIKKMIRRDFSFLVLNRDQTNSNGGGLTTTISTDKTEINYNLALFNIFDWKRTENPAAKNILTLSIDGGYNDNIGTVLSNSKANSKGGFSVKYSDILNKFTGPSIATSDINTICQPTTQLSKAYIEHLISKGKIIASNTSQVQKDRLIISIGKNLILQKRLKTEIAVVPIDPDIYLKKTQELDKKQNEYLDLLKLLNSTPPNDDTLKRSLYDSLIAYELANTKWNRATVSWWELEFGGNVEKSNVFDDISAINVNSEKKPTLFFGGFSVKSIINGKKRLFFWKAGYKLSESTNLTNADTYNLETSKSYPDNKISKTISAYKLSEIGKFEEFTQSTIELQGCSLFSKNTIGIDLFADLNFAHNSDIYTKTGVLNAGVGFIFTFLDQAKENAKANVELFIKFKDINAQTKISEKLDTWERYDVGVKLGLPFNKIILGK